jgi:hypothetical protein
MLVPVQFSFQKGISTENVAFILENSLFKSVNHEMHAGGTFCDLAEAFDHINH